MSGFESIEAPESPESNRKRIRQTGQPPYGDTWYRTPPSWQQMLFVPDLRKSQKEACGEAVRLLLEDELRALATKLAVANERLHDQYDRLKSEAALRLSVAPPLAAFFLIA